MTIELSASITAYLFVRYVRALLYLLSMAIYSSEDKYAL